MNAAILEALARRYVWWQEPADALAHRGRFLCQLMQLGTLEDVRAARSIRASAKACWRAWRADGRADREVVHRHRVDPAARVCFAQATLGGCLADD